MLRVFRSAVLLRDRKKSPSLRPVALTFVSPRGACRRRCSSFISSVPERFGSHLERKDYTYTRLD